MRVKIIYPSGAIDYLHKHPLGKMTEAEFLAAVKEQYGGGIKVQL